MGTGGAICASAISVSISGFDSAFVGTFRQNSTVTGGGAISTANSALIMTISGASISDNAARALEVMVSMLAAVKSPSNRQMDCQVVMQPASTSYLAIFLHGSSGGVSLL